MEIKYCYTAFLITVLLYLQLISGCSILSGSNESEASSFKIIYNDNGADGGSLQADNSLYKNGETVVIRNEGTLTKTDHVFVCWNTAPNGSGTDYLAGSLYTMGDGDLNLFAEWINAQQVNLYTIYFEANGAESGTVPDNLIKIEGYDLVLPDNQGDLKKSRYYFSHWNTKEDGSGDTFEWGDIFSINESVVLYPEWNYYETWIHASDGEADDQFGNVAISGDYFISGVIRDDDMGEDAGAAWIYHRTGDNSWDDGIKLLASDGITLDRFSCSNDISGDYAIVGAYGDDDVPSSSGCAWIYHRTGLNTWDSEIKIVASDAASEDCFGYGVAIDGNYAVCGSLYDDDNGSKSGSAYIFNRTGDNTWDAGTKITASDGAANDYFGGVVDIYGDYVIAGAFFDDDNGTDSGSVYVFHRTGTNTWDSGVKLVPSDGAEDDNFGARVAIHEDYAIVGAIGDDDRGSNSGSVYIFNRTGENTWDSGYKITDEEGSADDQFGGSVDITGDYALIGSSLGSGVTEDSGVAWLYERTELNIWTPCLKISASDGSFADGYSAHVSMDQKYIVIGAPADDDLGLSAGSAYAYYLP